MDTAVNMSSKYTNTVEMLRLLTDEELDAIQTVAKAFISAQHTKDPFSPKTKEEFFEEIDTGIRQFEEGKCMESERMENELLQEMAL